MLPKIFETNDNKSLEKRGGMGRVRFGSNTDLLCLLRVITITKIWPGLGVSLRVSLLFSACDSYFDRVTYFIPYLEGSFWYLTSSFARFGASRLLLPVNICCANIAFYGDFFIFRFTFEECHGRPDVMQCNRLTNTHE